jgi:hypothetical protein
LVTRERDGRAWPIGTGADVAWIAESTSPGRTVATAIPPVFEAYSTVLVEYGEREVLAHDRALLALLAKQSADRRWWLGYLDTGVDEVVFPDAPKVTLYAGWRYVLVEAGPEQAAAWHPADGRAFGTGDLPNLMFPADHSWLVSTLWDDDWSCVGGPAGLVEGLLRQPGCGRDGWRSERTPRHLVSRRPDSQSGRTCSCLASCRPPSGAIALLVCMWV